MSGAKDCVMVLREREGFVVNYIYILLLFLMSFSPLFAIGGYLSGKGTELEPYLIEDYEDLKVIKNDLTAQYRLTGNINATASRSSIGGEGFLPIGSGSISFSGSLDGAGYVVFGLYINRPLASYVGLLGRVTGGTVENLGVSGDITARNYVGLVVGQIADSTTISKCYGSGTVSGEEYIGGIVGYSHSSILENSYSNGFVSGEEYVGGAVGYSMQSTQNYSYSTAHVSANSWYGGLVGYNGSSVITESFWSQETAGVTVSRGGSVKTIQEMVQGATYSAWDFTTVWEIREGDSYPGLKGVNDAPFGMPDVSQIMPDVSDFSQFILNDVDVDSTNILVSKFTTYTRLNTAMDSLLVFYHPGEVLSAGDTLWGVGYVAVPYDTVEIATYDDLKKIGVLQAYPLNWNYRLTADIDASASVNENGGAGFLPIGSTSRPFTGSLNGAGHVIYGLHINRPESDSVGLFGYAVGATIDSLGVGGSVTGNDNVGLIIGQGYYAFIRHSHSFGSVTGIENVGGVAGRTLSSVIYYSYNTGRITGDRSTGGIVGYNVSTILSYSYNSGMLLGDFYVGGLIGWNTSASRVSGSYNTGLISGHSPAGLVGWNEGSSTISNCYTTGRITGRVSAHGLVQYNELSSTISSSYWNSETSGLTVSQGGSGSRTTSAMIQQSGFPGWSFPFAWEIREGVAFPVLKNMDNAPVGIGDSQEAFPDTLDFSSYVVNDLDGENIGITVTKFSGYADLNPTQDSLNIYYNPGLVLSAHDTLWGNATSVLVPYDTIEISTYDQLKLIGRYWKYPLVSNYRLTGNIDASNSKNENGGAGFEPIGSTGAAFTGSINGAGFQISGLYIHRPDTDFVGFFGYAEGASIDSITIQGDVTGNMNVGLLIGQSKNAFVSYCRSVGTVTGGDNVGGLLGYSIGTDIRSSKNSGTVSGYGSVGGLVGFSSSATLIRYSVSTGRVLARYYVGGLVGNNSFTSISYSYSTTAVFGSSNVGGLVGENDNGSNIENSYSTGDVLGANTKIGGLVGYHHSPSTISNSFSVGAVQGIQGVGGLIGDVYGIANITNSFWNTVTSGQDTSAKGTGLTHAEMMQESMFTGWDFSVDWEIREGVSYPGLIEVNDAPIGVPGSNAAVPDTTDFSSYLSTSVDVENSAITASKFAGYTQTNSIGDSLFVYYYPGEVISAEDTLWGSATYVAVPTVPIEISTYDDLKKIGHQWNYPLDGHYRLTADINASESRNENGGEGFEPIGNLTQAFRGSFKGGNHVIYGLYINRSTDYYIGLFGIVSSGTIDSLGVVGEVVGFSTVGLLGGYMNSGTTVTHCYSAGKVTAYRYNGGGLVGTNSASIIENSYSVANVFAYAASGGLVGGNVNATIQHSYSTGYVTGISGVRGLAGHIYGSNSINGYWNSEALGPVDSTVGIGLSTQQMLHESSFSGWDFTNAWEIREGESYPGLRGMDDAPFGLPDVNAVMPDTTNFTAFLINDVDVEHSAVTVSKYAGLSRLNESKDSLYVYYYPGEVKAPTDTLWGGATYVSVPQAVIAIATYDDLKNIGTHWQYLLDGRYRLTGDIDASSSRNENGGMGFKPIGTKESPFVGSFNGAGYTISGLYINRPETDYAGLFGFVQQGTIDSLGVAGEVTGRSKVGLLVGENYFSFTISNSFSVGSVSGTDYVGGLIGITQSPIINCFSRASVSASNSYAGGLIGYANEIVLGGVTYSSSIENSYSTGNVFGVRDIGGLVGSLLGSTIDNSYGAGSVSGTNYKVGGLTGSSYSSEVNNSYSTGDVSGYHLVGGLIGLSQNSGITNSYSTGYVSSKGDIGGLVGKMGDSTAIHSFWNIETSGQTLSDKGSGLTTTVMKEEAQFTGWNFTTSWNIHEGESYPGLRNVNNAPMAFRDSNSVATSFPLNQLLINDYDIESGQTSLVLTVDSLYGLGKIDSATWFSFPFGTNTGKVDSIRYRVGEVLSSGDTLWGNRAVALFKKSVMYSDPQAVTDAFSTPEDVPFAVPFSMLLANDLGVPFDSLKISSILMSPEVAVHADSVIYTPAPNWNGVDTLKYLLSGDGIVDTGMVIITVTAVNDAPTFSAIAMQEVYAGTPLLLQLSMTDAVDIDGDTLSFIIEGGPGYTVTDYSIVPDAGFIGALIIPVRITDGTIPTDVVSLTLNSIPPGNSSNGSSSSIGVTPYSSAGIISGNSSTQTSGGGGEHTWSATSGPSTGDPGVGTPLSSAAEISSSGIAPGGGGGISSVHAAPIYTPTDFHKKLPGMIISNKGNGNLILQAPASALSYSVYSIHGALIESGTLNAGTAYISQNVPQGVLFVRFE